MAPSHIGCDLVAGEPDSLSSRGDLSALLLQYGYQQAPAAVLGSTASALIVASVAAMREVSTALVLWLAVELGVCALGLLAAHDYRVGRLRVHERLAELVRGAITLAIGLAWGAAGILWSDPSSEEGLAALLCAGGLAAAASLTSAAGPKNLWFFTLPAFAPWFVTQIPQRAWLAGLLLFYLCVVTVVCHRAHGLLAGALKLRVANATLLQNAVRERERAESAQQQALMAVEARTRFLADAGHDLRQPLQALTLLTDVLEKGVDEPKRRDVVAALSRTTASLNTTIEGLLGMAARPYDSHSHHLMGPPTRTPGPLLKDSELS